MHRYQETVEALRTIIDSKETAVDGRLPTERELCRVVGVGRRMLRRALDELEEDGVIVRQQGRGTFVTANIPASSDGALGSVGLSLAPDPAAWINRSAGPVEQIELKFALEPVMARLAALRASALDVERLRRAATACETAKNPALYQQADRAFHRLIAELSRNALFQTLHDGVAEVMRDAALEKFGEAGHCFKRKADHVEFHRSIVDAIAGRNGDEASHQMHNHLRDVYQSLLTDNIPAAVGVKRGMENGAR